MEEEEVLTLRPLFEETLVEPTNQLELDFGPGLFFRLAQRPEQFIRLEPAELSKSPTECTRRTGCMAWDASVVLAGILANVSNVANVANVAGSGGDFDGAAFWRRLAAAGGGGGVIELGAGETGLAGLMAAKLLQCHCYLTDLPDVVPHLQHNIDSNIADIADSADADLSPGRPGSFVRATAYQWGESTALPRPSGLILAADCLYDTENVEPFVDALLELSGPSTECLVAFDTALNRWGAYDAFLAHAQEHWRVETLPWEVQLKGFRKNEVKVYWLSWYQERKRQRSLCDPTFGKAGIVYSPERIAESWEDFLDALGFLRSSPIRQHVRQLFSREDLEEQLQGLFDALSGGQPALDKGSFLNFSSKIRGQVHVLLDMKTKIALLPPTVEDSQWIQQSFDAVFPPEAPLDRNAFPGVAKLVLLRRVVRTLIEYVGIEELKGGMAAPLVVDIAVELQTGQPFHLRTVAPSSAPSRSGERLDLIAE